MSEFKYVASGFMNDAEKLLEDFIQENSTSFSVFANIWRKWSFSLIYMGRGTEEELKEFTQEIFYLTTKFITYNSSMYKVGGIFLLYALYRNQILSPPVRIRVVSSQLKSMLYVRDTLPFDEHKSFHYVLSYLMKNSFDFVACPKLMGPTVPMLTDVYKREDGDSILRYHAGLKTDMTELAERKVLKETGDMFSKYAEMKKTLNVPGIISDSTDLFEVFISRLDGLLDRAEFAKVTVPTKKLDSVTVPSTIGSRRAQLKAKAFGGPLYPKVEPDEDKVVLSDDDTTTNNDESGLDFPISGPYPLRKRIPKLRRNVGRPKKVEEVDEESDSGLSRRRRRKTIRRSRRKRCTTARHYYSEGDCGDLKLLLDYEGLKFLPSNSMRLFTDDSDVDDPEPVSGLLGCARPVKQ